MEPLEQVTVLMTLMKRLAQVMDHERALLRSMRLEALPEIQDEKEALAEAYEIELSRLRCSPEVLAALEPSIRSQLHEAMRAFQETVTANLNALAGGPVGGREGAAQHRRQPRAQRRRLHLRRARPGHARRAPRPGDRGRLRSQALRSRAQ